eukprot:m.81155 g.81155  ORF g.81155 m.81155 type:complete len:58 (-) comp12794_c0_seq2:70-243(-)
MRWMLIDSGFIMDTTQLQVGSKLHSISHREILAILEETSPCIVRCEVGCGWQPLFNR